MDCAESHAGREQGVRSRGSNTLLGKMESESAVQLGDSCFSKEASASKLLSYPDPQATFVQDNKRVGWLLSLVIPLPAFPRADVFSSSSETLLGALLKFNS